MQLKTGCLGSSNVAIGTIFRVVQTSGYVLNFTSTTLTNATMTTCQGMSTNCTQQNVTAYYMMNPSVLYPKGILYANNVVIDLNDPLITARLFYTKPTFQQLYNMYVSGWDLMGNPIYNFQSTNMLPYIQGFNCMAQVWLAQQFVPVMCISSQVSFNVNQQGIYQAWLTSGTGCSIQWTYANGTNLNASYYWPQQTIYLLQVTVLPVILPPNALVSFTYGPNSTFIIPNATNITNSFSAQVNGTRGSFYDPSLSG